MRKLQKSILLLIVLLITQPAYSKNFNKEEVIKDLPKMLGANNVGREFYFTFIPCIEESGSKNDLRIYISSAVRTKVVVSVPGKDYEKIKYTKPNDIIQFVLSPDIGQPYRKTVNDQPEPDQVWSGAGVHVVADDPIICYGMTRFQYSSDGFLALPVTALGKNYIIASYEDSFDGVSPPWIAPSYSGIVAAYDKTKVRFTMGGNDWSKTAGGTLPGETSIWNMNEGDVLLIAGLGAHSDLTGSIIQATKPVGVVSGNYCPWIPTNVGCCDVIEEMELPTSSWGTEYHVTKIANRKKNSIIRIFAKESKTTIYRDYLPMGSIKTAGGMQGTGFLSIRAADGDPRPVVISGDKPISVTQYNTGQQDDGVTSDPFQMVLTPIEQYQKEIVFNTPGIRGGFGFTTNYINLCYEATKEGDIPDDLEFATVNDGKYTWQKVKELFPDQGTPFAKQKWGKDYYSKTILLPGDGVYKIRASKPFAAYAYGFSSYDSYGFPASIAVKDLTKPDTLVDDLPPDPEWEMTYNGNVNVGMSKYVIDKPDNPEKRSNLSTIYMHKDLSYNYKLYTGDFMPCEDYKTTWSLNVVDDCEDALAVITFADCAGNDTTIFIEYYAKKWRINPSYYDFGEFNQGDSAKKIFYIVNYSDADSIKLDNISLSNKYIGFSLWNEQGTEPLAFPMIIEPQDSIPFLIKFNANIKGNYRDSLFLEDNYFSCFKCELGVNILKPTNVADGLVNQFLRISPNPANNRLDIAINNNEITMQSIQITDINGYIIYSKQLQTNISKINISSFPNGSYYLNIITNKGLIKRKFIVLH